RVRWNLIRLHRPRRDGVVGELHNASNDGSDHAALCNAALQPRGVWLPRVAECSHPLVFAWIGLARPLLRHLAGRHELMGWRWLVEPTNFLLGTPDRCRGRRWLWRHLR